MKNSQNFINVRQTLSKKKFINKNKLLLTYKEAVSFFQERVECKSSIPLVTNTYRQAIQSALKISHISDNSSQYKSKSKRYPL